MEGKGKGETQQESNGDSLGRAGEAAQDQKHQLGHALFCFLATTSPSFPLWLALPLSPDLSSFANKGHYHGQLEKV